MINSGEIITFSVPGQPVAKGRARVTARGGFARAYTPAKTRKYEDLVRICAAEAMGDREPFDCAVTMTITAYVQPPKSMRKRDLAAALAGELNPTTRPDADNYAKAALDGCNAILFRDDSVVTDLIVRKRYALSPRLLITLETAQ